MRTVVPHILAAPVAALTLSVVAASSAAAEEFKYYVWIDDQGIVHAEEEAPEGVDYEVRIIEDINANVVPAEDFRLGGDMPVDYGSETETSSQAPDPAASPQSGQAADVITPASPEPE